MLDAQILLTGVALGVSIAAPPGPITALSAQELASGSWLSGWLVTAGATTADAVFFVLTYFGIARLVTSGERGILFVFGGVFLLYLARSTMLRVGQVEKGVSPGQTLTSPYVKGLTMGLTNPFQLGWWVAVGASMVSEFGSSIAAGFFIGIVGWTLVFTALVRTGVSRYQRLAPLIAIASAVLMAGFGAWFIVTAASIFL